MANLHFYPLEKWKDLKLDYPLKFKYAISNFGRLLSYSTKKEQGTLLKGGTVGGYKVFGFRGRTPQKIISKHLLFHKLVAEHFVKGKTTERSIVIHLDYNRTNNHFANLKWVNQSEMTEHHQKSPRVIKARKDRKGYSKSGDGYKLTSTQVKLIKKLLADPERKTRKKMIAKRFNVSEMCLHRIKTGENWGHINIA